MVVKKHRRDRKLQLFVSAALYEAMFFAYCQQQSISHVSREVGVSTRTASRYINEGDPARNLKPIRARWLALQVKTMERTDAKLAERQADTLATAANLRQWVKASLAAKFEQDANGKIRTNARGVPIMVEAVGPNHDLARMLQAIAATEKEILESPDEQLRQQQLNIVKIVTDAVKVVTSPEDAQRVMQLVQQAIQDQQTGAVTIEAKALPAPKEKP